MTRFSAMPADPLLRAAGLVAIRDGRTLFDGLDVEVRAGEVVRVEGPNGAGKTTLLRILCGLDQDYAGDIAFPQAEAARRPWRADVLFLGHLPGLKPTLTAAENLDWLTRLRAAALRGSVSDALATVGLAGYEDVPVAQMSAGQKRRVALARLHLEPAPLWVLDEPFTAIDKDGVASLEATLAGHAGQGGAVLVTTHHALSINARPLRLGTSA